MPKKELVTIDDRELALSNLTKVLFPGAGFTKGEVIAYYSEVAEIILPHLQSRPLTLKRYPDGVTKEHFYEKNAPSYTPKWVETFEVPRETSGSLLAEVGDPIRFSVELQGSANEVVAAVAQLGLEGVVAKRRDSLYEPGERSGAWMKFRTNNAQEFVIGGYIPGSKDFDALLVGYYSGKDLLYAAKVRNGFVAIDKTALGPKLKRLRSSTCPFTNLPEPKGGRWGESLTAEKMKECVWVKPESVCQVSFIQWTSAGHLRHCSFTGMRQDKAATDVVRET